MSIDVVTAVQFDKHCPWKCQLIIATITVIDVCDVLTVDTARQLINFA